ncbi:hypothetical protein [Flavobacterium urocaniciphilum]|uniref:Uncharacterized protein n=1 Tax=Flavobacterium urocaniciphilum TaxID=1299341 RepID=A0A1H8ZGK1_9FLAO|nr:hypothetical protein [Flavobacterium urocaniciphilum]SEP63542.1 hypothetical protein SAMN05444005_101701 [Flavobacterium urocaniciphilum]
MKRIILIIIFLNSILIYGQTDCGFKIDEQKILKNENLDFFLDKMKTEKFKVTNKKEKIPKQVLKQLKCLTRGFTIANPGEEYQDSDIIDTNKILPGRRLIFLAKSKHNLIMVYEVSQGARIVFINFDKTTIKDFWCGVCMGKPKIKSIKQVIDHIQYYRDKAWGLNTNIITF